MLSENSYSHWINSKIYGMGDITKFSDYFLNFITMNNFENKIKIYSIQDDNETYSKNKINIILCVENCNFHKHYKHHNKYKDTGNTNIDIYLYNHYSNFIINEKYIIIPVIYLQVYYFKIKKNIIYPTIYTNFNNKKFCLQVSFIRHRNNINNKILNNINKLKSIGNIDTIKLHKSKINDVSCYHSEKLLNLFNNYKFILCFENSYTKGYITEKIFNGFFSKSIPIYTGPSDINRYINKDSYIDLLNINTNQITNLMNNEDKYNNFLKINKICNFDDENYIIKSNQFIEKIMKRII